VQRYDKIIDGTILKIEGFVMMICRDPNESRLARSRYCNIYKPMMRSGEKENIKIEKIFGRFALNMYLCISF